MAVDLILLAKAITDMIGYPEYILNDKVQLDKKYEDLHIDGKTSYFENVLRNRAFVLSEEMKKLSRRCRCQSRKEGDVDLDKQ